MRTSEINIEITLDEQNVPEKIEWNATDSPSETVNDAKAMALAFWDQIGKGTVKIDLWTKDLEVHEMKRFIIEVISGLADTVRNATYDELMAIDMENLCKQLSLRLEQDIRLSQQM